MMRLECPCKKRKGLGLFFAVLCCLNYPACGSFTEDSTDQDGIKHILKGRQGFREETESDSHGYL